jgi:hypothetical protein
MYVNISVGCISRSGTLGEKLWTDL